MKARVTSKVPKNGNRNETSFLIAFSNFDMVNQDLSHAPCEVIEVNTEVYKLCKQLFAEVWDGHTPLRLLGVALTDLTKEDTAQMTLLPDEKKERSRKLDKAYDAINKKFGAATIQRGSNLQSDLRVGKKYQAQMEQKQKK